MPFCANCGEKVEDNLKICKQCGKSLEKSENKRTLDKNFYVPIDFSEVREAIPVGEDVIYSCLFTVNTHGLTGPFKEKSRKFQSHVLFTKNGIAYQVPKTKTTVIMKSKYLPWYKIEDILLGYILFKEGTIMYNFMMEPNTNYESYEEYDMRIWRFFFEFVPLVINQKKERKVEVKKIEQRYNKMKRVLGEEECEFFRTIDNYEDFMKHKPLLKKAMSEVAPNWGQEI